MDTALAVSFIAFGLGFLAGWGGLKLQQFVNKKNGWTK